LKGIEHHCRGKLVTFPSEEATSTFAAQLSVDAELKPTHFGSSRAPSFKQRKAYSSWDLNEETIIGYYFRLVCESLRELSFFGCSKLTNAMWSGCCAA